LDWKLGVFNEEVQAEKQDKQPSWLSTLFPYAFVVLILLLLCKIWLLDKAGIVVRVTEFGALLLIGIVLVRQLFTMRTIHDANQHLARLSATDPLTGLPNHRTLMDTLESELERARRADHCLSVIFFDGDHFKRVNDTYGHAAGDGVLRELGARVQSVLRAGNRLGRYGGEEFLVLLPECDQEQAHHVAERMREAVAAFPLLSEQVEGGIKVTISVGVATYPLDATSASQEVEQADQAMYWAKRLGRNRVLTSVQAQQASQDVSLTGTFQNLHRVEKPVSPHRYLRQDMAEAL